MLEDRLGPAVPATYLALRNFADLPLWNMIFGTCANPVRFDGEAGFGEGIGLDGAAWRRVGAMLAFADAHGART